MTDHDRLFKELLTTFFSEFIELFLPSLFDCLDPASIVFLDKELFTDVTAGDAYEADLVARVRLRSNDSFILVHTEAQAHAQNSFERRMFCYFSRLHERHNLPVYPIVLFSFDRPFTQQGSCYELKLPGLEVLRFQYKVIQLNRLNWRSYLKRDSPVSAALMAKMKFAQHERFRVKLECLRMIADLRLDRAKSRLIAGFVDSYLRLNESEESLFVAALEQLEEPRREGVMEIVTSWMEKGLKEGFERGREQGLEQGQARGMELGLLQGRHGEAASLVNSLLTRRFGELGQVCAQITELSLEQLEQLAVALLDFSDVADLERWLKSHVTIDI